MPATLTPVGLQRYVDNDGRALVGGHVYTYETGTSTPKPTYADAEMTQPNTNPIILDARGEAVIYWSGAYKVVLTDSDDVQIWSVDPVKSVPDNPLDNPMTDAGDLIVGGVDGMPGRFPAGSSGQILSIINGVPAWEEKRIHAKSFNSASITSNLSADVIGGIVQCTSATPITLTLPNSEYATVGDIIEFFNSGEGSATLSPFGTDILLSITGIGDNPVLYFGDSLTITYQGSDTWIATQGVKKGLIDTVSSDLDDFPLNHSFSINRTEQDCINLGMPATGRAVTDDTFWNVQTLGTDIARTIIATPVYLGAGQGQVWVRNKQDADWSDWHQIYTSTNPQPKGFVVFTASGTFTTPDILKIGKIKPKITVTGGGGGGGGYTSDGTGATISYCGGSGGGTAIGEVDLDGVETVPVTVGVGGATTSGSARGGTGGTSSFGTYISATGGVGGASTIGAHGNGVGGMLNIAGGDGGSTSNVGSLVGAGSTMASFGGGSYFGGPTGHGLSATTIGCGGGGGTASTTVGLGFRGVVIVEW